VNLYKSRIKPLFLIVIAYIKRKIHSKNDHAIYFGIEDYKGISSCVYKFSFCANQAIWLWNPRRTLNISEIEFKILLITLKITGVQVWTFDYNDSVKYKLNYHPQVYSLEFSRQVLNKKLCEELTNPVMFDIFFIGVDKGRLELLNTFAKLLDDASLSFSISVLPDKNKHYDECERLLAKNAMNYDEYLDKLFQTTAILEIVQPGQGGLTIRTLEALFYNKKLITNNESITEYDFYNADNIFIYKEQDCNIDALKSFLKKNNVIIEQNILRKYDINHLINEILQSPYSSNLNERKSN
ncbi:TPA: hypothetical protein ACG651_005155, partial [Escherichia coli]